MRSLFFLTVLLASPGAGAVNPIGEVTYQTPVFQRPSEESKVLFYLNPKEQFRYKPARSAEEEFVKIAIQRKGKLRVGYIPQIALSEQDTELERDSAEGGSPEARPEDGSWLWGGGLQWSRYVQKSRSFATEDNVQYRTSDYRSQGLSPFLSLQYQDMNFWRLSFAYKPIKYKATSTTDVNMSRQEALTLDYNMASFLLQRSYSPFDWPGFYLGLGLGLERALSTKLTLDSAVLPTGSEDLATYYIVQVFTGGRLKLGKSMSLFTEARLGFVTSQSPSVLQVEATLGLLRRL